ncbi:class I SAM-dependent methyltransferase [Solimonas terrae]|uniref:Methyltransferase domain-containing protein n=1 Tax=Solimonas terrae TaxID=1396819 RepID=A0A6M2BNQ1_9GAMM|nr:methyltransferase domain-containing protein [Solimonas terrae]NGY03677.1 methyltransferase domain-containing protein [Solimonas terrae]
MTPARHPRGRRLSDRGALEQWSASPRGQRLLALESAELRRLLPDIFGRHVLQIGSWLGDSRLLEGAETLHRAVLGTAIGGSASAVIDPEHLPLPARSVDALVLPHTIEFSGSPHTVLREAARVLNDRGRLFLLGFSPWSWLAWRQRLGLRARNFPPGARYYGAGRVGDWLQLLDFDIVDVRRFGSGFPWLAPRSITHPWTPGNLLAPLAESYLIVARRRVLPINLVGKTQRAQIKPLIGVATPAAQRQGLDGEPKPAP